MNAIPFPRPCKIQSSSWGYEGVCLAIFNGEALVENDSGQVNRHDLLSHGYWITFLDR